MQTSKARITRVVDGDTIEVLRDRGLLRQPQLRRIRMWGIDSPESDQKGGREATDHMTRLVGNKTRVVLEERGEDQYGRLIAIVHQGKPRAHRSLNYRMIRDGHAECYLLDDDYRQLYRDAERHARDRKLGMWQNEGMQNPARFRREQRAREEIRVRVWLRIRLWAGLAVLATLLAYIAGKYLGLW